MLEKLYDYSITKQAQPQPHYRRYLFSCIDFSQKMIALLGARGSGKTTLLLQFLQSLQLPIREKLYLSADHPLLAGESLLELARAFESIGGRVLVIDEIHQVKSYCKELKAIYDFTELQVIVTGSSAIHLEQCQSDLSRRALVYRLPELSFREYLELITNQTFSSYPLLDLLEHHMEYAHEILRAIKPLKYFSGYLRHGMYPFFLEGETLYDQRMVEIVDQTLRSDVSEIYGLPVSSLGAMKKLLQVLCRSKPYEIRYEQVASACGISKNTLKTYLYYLHESSLIRTVGGEARGNAYIAKPEKLYLHNTNLHAILCEENEAGTLRETLFAMLMSEKHALHYPEAGDFQIDGRWLFEVGGKKKSFEQIKNLPDSYVVADEIESGFGNKIPLWLFGFLY